MSKRAREDYFYDEQPPTKKLKLMEREEKKEEKKKGEEEDIEEFSDSLEDLFTEIKGLNNDMKKNSELKEEKGEKGKDESENMDINDDIPFADQLLLASSDDGMTMVPKSRYMKYSSVIKSFYEGKSNDEDYIFPIEEKKKVIDFICDFYHCATIENEGRTYRISDVYDELKEHNIKNIKFGFEKLSLRKSWKVYKLAKKLDFSVITQWMNIYIDFKLSICNERDLDMELINEFHTFKDIDFFEKGLKILIDKSQFSVKEYKSDSPVFHRDVANILLEMYKNNIENQRNFNYTMRTRLTDMSNSRVRKTDMTELRDTYFSI